MQSSREGGVASGRPGSVQGVGVRGAADSGKTSVTVGVVVSVVEVCSMSVMGTIVEGGAVVLTVEESSMGGGGEGEMGAGLGGPPGSVDTSLRSN